jgi:predicted dehydrogenase
MARKLNVGVIGMGWPGREHLKGYLELDNVNVVALCDLNAELAGKVAADSGVGDVETDHKRLLARADIDAVSVCLPNFLHKKVTVDALRAGKHVICEKPPALNAREAQQMADAAKKSKKQLMYAMVLRYGAQATTIRSYVDSGQLGDIYFGHAAYVRRRGIPLGAGGWFVDKKRAGGGALIDIGVHALDRCWYLMGCPRPAAIMGSSYRKFAHLTPKGMKFDVDDASFGMVRFTNGATLMLEATWAINLPNAQVTRVAGAKGGATWDPLTIYTEQNGVPVDITPQVTEVNPFFAEVAHFVDCCTKRTPCKSGAEQGVHLQQMLDGIYKSAATGKEVRVR